MASAVRGGGRARHWEAEGQGELREAALERSPSASSLASRMVFPDPISMKENLRQQLAKPVYDVSMYYHATGFCRSVATHQRFEQLTLLVIAANAIWIWIDTDYNPAPMLLLAHPAFQIVEHLFCMYFSFEWTMRFLAFRRKRDGLRDGWFVFDSLLVMMMVAETWVMTACILLFGSGPSASLGNASILRMARLLRLSRMARMARLLRAMPELLILIKGMAAATRSVVFTIGLLFVILYVFSIAFVQLCADSDCMELFPSVWVTVHFLLLNAVFLDSLAAIVEPLYAQNVLLLVVFYGFLLIATLTLMNMLIGVICEVVSAVASTERESLTLGYVHEKLQELMLNAGADENNDQLISKAEFMQLLSNKKAVSILQEVGVDVVGLVDFTDTIFEAEFMKEGEEDMQEEKRLSFVEFMNVVLDMRGTNTATVRDVVDLRKYINGRIDCLERKLVEGYTLKRSRVAMDEDANLEKESTSAPALSFQKLLDNSMREIFTSHEHEVRVLRSENRRLAEKLAQVSDECSTDSRLAELRFLSELDLLGRPENSLVGLPNALPGEVVDPGPQQRLSGAPLCTCSRAAGAPHSAGAATGPLPKRSVGVLRVGAELASALAKAEAQRQLSPPLAGGSSADAEEPSCSRARESGPLRAQAASSPPPPAMSRQ